MYLPSYYKFTILIFLIIYIELIDSNRRLYTKEGNPIVKTNHGLIQGVTKKIQNLPDFEIDVFYGIPYAEPPIGNLRFERPKPPHEWNDILLAINQPPPCPAHVRPNEFMPHNHNYSEDCLYLNIFAPSQLHDENKAKSNLNPVLIVIHGGAHSIGSAQQYADYEDIGVKYVSNNIVVVIIQYRLGALGFASTGDRTFPGNYALWDQTEALRFVQDNIVRFGGNYKQVTLLGVSSGAASVSILSVSPYSRDYFQRGIQLSGSAMAARMLNERVVNETWALTYELGCANKENKLVEDSIDVKNCLRTKSLDEIFDAVNAIGPTRLDVNNIKFSPRVDEILLPKDFPYLVQESPIKPMIMGITTEEALLHTLIRPNTSLSLFSIPIFEQKTFDETRVKDLVAKIIAPTANFAQIGSKNYEKVAQRVQSAIFDYYCNKDSGNELKIPKVKDNNFYLQRYTQIISDLQYVVPLVWESRIKAQANWPLFLYWNAYVNEQVFPAHVNIKGFTLEF